MVHIRYINQPNGVGTMKYFDVRIWEKAEHWYFDTTIEAKDERDAWKVALKEYPKREYNVREVREIIR
jgi:hypothetical protein